MPEERDTLVSLSHFSRLSFERDLAYALTSATFAHVFGLFSILVGGKGLVHVFMMWCTNKVRPQI